MNQRSLHWIFVMTLGRLSRLALAAGTLTLIAVLALAMTAREASAHGVQVDSDPAPNVQLEDTPELVTVTFNEPIEPSVSTIQILDQTGQPVELGALRFFDDPKIMGVEVPEELPPGLYTVIWRNLSTVDGHTWQGSFPFGMLGPGGVVPGGEVASAVFDLAQAPSNNPSTLETAARWVVLLGSAVMLGGAAYALFVVSPAARVLAPDMETAVRSLSRTVLVVTVAIAAFFVLEGSLLQLVVQAGDLGGLGRLDDLLLDTRSGRYLLARQGLLVFGLLSVGLLWRSRGGLTEALALGGLVAASLGVLLTQSLVSHAAASGGEFWTTGIDVLHIVAAALWVGGLVHVGLAMPRWLDDLKGPSRTLFAAESFRRFSILAAFSVTVLLASGMLSALVQFTEWNELWSTTYGWSLVGKLGVIVPLLAVAGLNAFFLRPRVEDAVREVNGGGAEPGDGTAGAVVRLQRLLSNTVRAEAVLGIAVLAAVAVLIQIQTPRTAAEAEELSAAAEARQTLEANETGFQETSEDQAAIISLEIEPARVGQNRFEMGIGSEFGSVGEIQLARLTFDHENPDVGSSNLDLELAGSASYAAEGSNISLPGNYTVTVSIQRRGADDLQVTFDVPIVDPAALEERLSAAEEEGIWRWPFDGGRSVFAIVVLGVAGAIAAGYGLLRVVRPA